MRRFLELSILILALVASGRLYWGDSAEKGQRAAAEELALLRQAVDEYALANRGRYPDSLEELRRPDVNGSRFLEGQRLTRDPWGNLYRYERPTRGSDPRVYSLGADGLVGGRGEDADVFAGGDPNP